MKRQLTAVVAILLLHASQASAQSDVDLSITVDASADVVVTGSPVVYTLTVTNEGSEIAWNVTVHDVLPPETTFVSCTATGDGICEGEGNNRTALIPSIAPDASETVTLVALLNCAVADGEDIANTATVASPNPDPEEEEADNETVFIAASNPPPAITGLTATPSVLWPPNHKMKNVTVDYDIVDNCGPVQVDLQVASNEPSDGPGDGHTSPDWQVLDLHHVQLRAERSGRGSGRIYSVAITASDSMNQSATAVAAVRVPHNR
jgi:uncharacterized repeat protein (TIGR01451 family)